LCKECIRSKNKQWVKNNPEKRVIGNRGYQHTPKCKEAKRIREQKRRDRGENIKWQQNNREKIKEYNEKRKHKNHNISKKEWIRCKQYFDNSCAYCGMNFEDHKKKFNQDLHKEHVEHEGASDISNCVPSCKPCNSSKKEELLDIWYNKSNKNYTEERYDKILKWVNGDYRTKIL
jgi:hypothetical protein